MRSLCIGAGFLFVFLVVLSGFHDAWIHAAVSLTLLVGLCITAFPLSRVLFPDRIESWILVFPIGFTIHAVGMSFAGLFFGVHRWTSVAYLLIALLLFVLSQFLFRRKSGTEAAVSQWTQKDIVLLFVWLVVVVTAVALPFARVGEETAQGYAYRAYFNADFFRNMAVTGSLVHVGIPPDNPYLSGYTLHYYWFFHLIVAYWRELIPSYRPDLLMVQLSLVALAIFTATLFVVLRRFIRHRKTAMLLLPVFVFGGSYEGLYVLQWLKNRQSPWTEFVNLNIDGILRWNWKAPQIDTLYRALLYAPQHLIALAIFLIALLIWNSERLKEEPLRCNTRRLVFYFLIFASLGFSAFVGATLIVGAALVLGIRTLLHPQNKWKELLLSASLGIVFLFIYLFLFKMFQPGSQQFDIGPDKIISAHFLSYFVLNWGALLILGVAGVFYSSLQFPNRILVSYLIGCFLMIFFVRIMLAGFSDISLKVGHFSHVVLLMLAAGFMDRVLTNFPKRVTWLVLGVLLLTGPAFVTWGMDAWNSSDIKNRRFTTYMKQQDAEVCRWMRSNLPPKTVVFNYSPRYDDFIQDIIPAFGERSVYLGNRIFSRIFQVPEQDVRDRTHVVSSFLKSTSPAETWALARKSGIQFIFVSGLDIQAMPQLIEKLATPYFSLVMQEGQSGLFRVNAEVDAKQTH